MGAEAATVGPTLAWGTWEALILGCAVLRHGTGDWNVVASELRARTLHPHSFTPEVCKAKFEDLQKCYAGSMAWFEELRKQRVAELKRELARSDDSIGSLELKIKSLEAERQNSNQADYDSPQTESPRPVFNSDGTESVCKEASKDENSAGSFTKDTRTAANWSCERHKQETETEIDTKPDVSVSSEQGKELRMEKLAEVGYGQGVTFRKPRGQRKRKTCHQAVKEGSVKESDNIGSFNGVSTAKRKDCNQAVKGESDKVRSPNGGSAAKRKDYSQVAKGESDGIRSSQGVLTTKRKDCNQAVKGESDNVRSSNVLSTAKRKDCNQSVKVRNDTVRSSNGVVTAKRKDCNKAVKKGSVRQSNNAGSSKGASASKRKDPNQAVKVESDNDRSSNGALIAKRKDCKQAVKEGSVEGSDNVWSSKGVLTAKRKDCSQAIKEGSVEESDIPGSSEGPLTAKRKDCSQADKEGSVGECDTLVSSKGASTSKRKGCTQAVKEGSVGESDNVGSSNVVSTARKATSTTDCDQITGNSGSGNHNCIASIPKRHSLMDIFQSIASSEPAAVFRHRMDSQKRARYRKIIKQHLDIGTIRSRINGHSIKSEKELFRDLLLLSNNALVFYSRRTREYKSALSLRNLVMKEYKQHCRESCKEATSAFLLAFSPPVKPRTARPRPLARLCREWASEKLLDPEKAAPAKVTEPCDPDANVSLSSLRKAKKGVKRPGKGKPEPANTQHKTAPARQRKRVRK